DIIEYHSYNNPKFIEAIEKCKEKIMNNISEIESWFVEGGQYENAFAISDIISALSDNRIMVPLGHTSEYWSNAENVSLEIFANISAIDVLDSAEKVEFDTLLKEIYNVYKEMVL
ncbi:MAG: phage head morphogenesis protein, partial [Lachnospiraceae bacterium]|nr:phage head morphogenesis protein [Lachnospiraceae bacterium]